MFPFIHIGPLTLPTYGILLATSLLVGIQWGVARAPKLGLPAPFIYSTGALCSLVAVLGTKVTDWIIRGGNVSFEAMITAGGTFLGGFLLAIITAAVASHRAGLSMWRVGDCAAPSFSLGVILVRIGCFGASCDYGKPTDLPWGVVFTNAQASLYSGIPLGVRLHPSQLYESALGVLILITVLTMESRWFTDRFAWARRSGVLILTFGTMYSTGRFILEYWRGDLDRGFYGPFSTSQWLSIITVALFWIAFRLTARGEILEVQPKKARA